MKVGVIDYGVGNLGSVLRALEELKVTPQLVATTAQMDAMDSLILPGVGNFSDCAKLLAEGDWVSAIKSQAVDERKPLLGICVGMQLLASLSTEGHGDNGEPEPAKTPGLNLIPGRVVHLRELGCKLRVPHVGWNSVSSVGGQESLFAGIPDMTDFYFVHSYAFVPDDAAHILATADYGVSVVAAVRRDNIWGTQFHPEKSSKAGFRLLRNFVEGGIC